VGEGPDRGGEGERGPALVVRGVDGGAAGDQGLGGWGEGVVERGVE
jgi:hypothetical protein